jgi:hypothetical protein
MFLAILIVLANLASFACGAKYGREAEKAVVGKVLAEYGKVSAQAVGLVQSVLSRLEKGYSVAYDDAVRDFDFLKKAL